IYTTQDFVGPVHMWRPDATLVNSPSLTLEEVEAIVDEAHRLGLKVACHTYGGEGMRSCLTAGVDAPNHLLELDDAGIKVLLEKKLSYVVTLDDLIALEKDDLRDTGGRNSRMRLAEQAFKRALAAGVPIVFGSGATSPAIPHGTQANHFAYYAKRRMKMADNLSRRHLLKLAAALPVTAGVGELSLRPRPASAAPATSNLMSMLSTYMSEAASRKLPEEIVEKTKQVIVDTVAAMIS